MVARTAGGGEAAGSSPVIPTNLLELINMTQRISIRVRVTNSDKVLLIRRSDGRESILGKYELPGGRVDDGEQPEDAAKRYLASDVGVSGEVSPHLEDAFTYIDRDNRELQYVVIVYRVVIGNKQRSIKLGGHYDKYVWYTPGKIESDSITDISQIILGNLPLHQNPLSVDVSTVKQPDDTMIVYSDGGSRGNPGPSAAGYIVIDRGDIVDQGGDYLGITTNNQAEYHGVALGLEAAQRLGAEKVEVRVDSMLVANQLKGIYKIKNRELWPVNERVNELIKKFQTVKFTHVPRELNQLADGEVNKVLDRQRRGDVV